MSGTGGADGVPPAGGGSGGPEGPLNLIHTNNSPNPASMRVPGVVCMPLQPWKEGLEAGRAGAGVCPYRTGTPEALSWHSGYVEGRADAPPGR